MINVPDFIKRNSNKLDRVVKRDGQIVDFDKKKIISAVFKALQATESGNEKLAEKLSEQVMDKMKKKFSERTIPAVEEIQDLVEEVLVENKLTKTVRSYVLYRTQHALIRDYQNFVDSDKLMEGYLHRQDWRVKENSNMSYSLQGLNNHVASKVSNHYWLHKIYPPEIRQAHLEGDFHIHDLQAMSPYCAGWDLKDILIKGFRGVSGKVQSKPPKHFRTALGQVVNFFYTIQGETAGAVAFSSFDTLLAPFIRYDNLTFEAVKQVMQEFIFNMNVPTRVGFQSPFTNITLDITVPRTFQEESVIIGGQPQKEIYKEFQPEMDMFNRAFAEVMTAGDASGRVFTFPIPTYNLTKDMDWDSGVMGLIWDMTAKYGIPYFSNFVNSDMKPEDARSMCCRLRLDNRELRKRGGGLFGANPLTGSLGVVTLNMARIGYLAKDKDDLLQRVTKLMDLARQSLEIKREVVEKFTDAGLYPYSRFYLNDIKEHFNEYWRNHFNTIGLNGLNECVLNFLGKDLGNAEANELAQEILEFMRNRLMDYQLETNNLYNLEATPAEGTSYRLARVDKKKYPDIIVANEQAVRTKDAEPYYTNSSNLPVGLTDDIFSALDLQDNLQTKYTGGTVLHLFIGERLTNGEVVKKLAKKIAYNYHLPYFSVTPTFSICPEHGYIAGEYFHCPECAQETEVYSRVVGYLRPVQQWNDGKRAEYNERKVFKIKEEQITGEPKPVDSLAELEDKKIEDKVRQDMVKEEN